MMSKRTVKIIAVVLAVLLVLSVGTSVIYSLVG